MLAASAAVFATRLILMTALVGAFVLAIMAVQSGSWLSLGVLVAYAILIVIPLVWLETRTRWQAG